MITDENAEDEIDRLHSLIEEWEDEAAEKAKDAEFWRREANEQCRLVTELRAENDRLRSALEREKKADEEPPRS
jgi:hypothetical protein